MDPAESYFLPRQCPSGIAQAKRFRYFSVPHDRRSCKRNLGKIADGKSDGKSFRTFRGANSPEPKELRAFGG
jgi:hypothetical protein